MHDIKNILSLKLKNRIFLKVNVLHRLKIAIIIFRWHAIKSHCESHGDSRAKNRSIVALSARSRAVRLGALEGARACELRGKLRARELTFFPLHY